jgi:hypothetical protein
VPILLHLHIILLNIFQLVLFFKPKSHTVHPHNYSHILNMVHLKDILFFKPRQRLANPFSEQISALLVRIRHYKTVHMHQWHLSSLHVMRVVGKDIEELNRIHWQVHIKVVRLLKISTESLLFSVQFAHDLPCAHVRAYHFVLDFVQLSVMD